MSPYRADRPVASSWLQARLTKNHGFRWTVCYRRGEFFRPGQGGEIRRYIRQAKVLADAEAAS